MLPTAVGTWSKPGISNCWHNTAQARDSMHTDHYSSWNTSVTTSDLDRQEGNHLAYRSSLLLGFEHGGAANLVRSGHQQADLAAPVATRGLAKFNYRRTIGALRVKTEASTLWERSNLGQKLRSKRVSKPTFHSVAEYARKSHRTLQAIQCTDVDLTKETPSEDHHDSLN